LMMEGSNSIKYVLPSILNSSDYLKGKYSQPIYGAGGGIKSYNFKDKTWVVYDDDGLVKDPYGLLVETDDENGLGVITDGGQAMTAYAGIQFEDIPDDIREHVATSLLRYCELDTLAMVLIWESWNDFVNG